MRKGDGQAIFTAECSHSFHFQCIVSNVKHGNRICPVCRAKWRDIPLQGPSSSSSSVERNNGGRMRVVRGMPLPRSNSSHNIPPLLQMLPEPATFDDDEMIEHKNKTDSRDGSRIVPMGRKVGIKAFTEVSTVPVSDSVDSFTVLLNLKAPPCSGPWHGKDEDEVRVRKPSSRTMPRAPVDLVTVLDTSGSMAGSKLALLKRAMGFVIQNLGPNDRLAIVSFSSTARRIFPLRRMSEAGRQQALLAVNSLIANGGTNIAEGLSKGAKVMDDRRERNSIASIILLSDGQDTYTVNKLKGNVPNYQLLLPSSLCPDEPSSFKIPVHAFGFGADHDASAMHTVSEISGGTFSFIETEGVIQDAFAQCIGGLLSVVVKDLHLAIESVHPAIRIASLKAGNYRNQLSPDHGSGAIDVGDLYADEERDFLISINIPPEDTTSNSGETGLLKVRCAYIDPLTEEPVAVESDEIRVKRCLVVPPGGSEEISIEVDRQRNRVQAAEGMIQARAAAESGDVAGAVVILEDIRKLLANSISGKSQDRLCLTLDAELKEMQERMASRRAYEVSGRAYILSGLSSHSWQRATARGDSTDFSSLVQAYQTPSMVEMVTRSQAAASLGSSSSPSAQRLLRPVWSFGSQRKAG
ncbi:hypothetical protein M569_01084 [Genlisea aurea]|uniref:VWFA domain-containing protein n=1 Tax=Genlisea aurea TaxID=192259 RepID=S8D871_9LAMI|nr:hypothetical protein M569_01084 [Genlisea aurea]